jgi:hypothetical protein
MMKCGIALGLLSLFGGVGALSLFLKIIMIEYLTSIFVIPCLQSAGGGFDIRYSLFQSFFFDLTGRFSGQRRRLYQRSSVFIDNPFMGAHYLAISVLNPV